MWREVQPSRLARPEVLQGQRKWRIVDAVPRPQREQGQGGSPEIVDGELHGDVPGDQREYADQIEAQSTANANAVIGAVGARRGPRASGDVHGEVFRDGPAVDRVAPDVRDLEVHGTR